MKAFFLTTFALAAFAFNSILCRLALAPGEIDAVGFTLIRLVSGAVTLAALVLLLGKTRNPAGAGNWGGAFFLFAYAIAFSFAYLGLTVATGALILFGSVQLTMVGVSIAQGERPSLAETLGLLFAFAGLVYLVFPGLTAPPLWSSILMTGAGAAWAFYTLRGRGSSEPLAETAGNFLRSVPLVVIAAVPFIGTIKVSAAGALLAVASGALASGVGYAVWYSALRYHTVTRAAVVQLSVPVIAAVGGVLLLSEPTDLRLAVAGVLILGGIGLTILRRSKRATVRPELAPVSQTADKQKN